MTTKRQHTVAMRPATYAVFEALREQLTAQRPFGVVSRAELLAICVNSAATVLTAAGELKPPKKAA